MGLTGKVTKTLGRAWLDRRPLQTLQQRLIRRGGATGLCYHSVSDAYPGYPFVTAPAAFEAHLDFLTETFEIRQVREVAAWLAAGALPRTGKPLAFLSFDDAYLDNLHIVTPLLEKYEVPATLFAPRDLVRRGGHTHMTEAELKKIAAHPLWEVGAHGVTHNVLPAFAPADIRTELQESRDWLAELIGASVPGFAYPQGQICPGSIAMARETYTFAVSTDRRIGDAFDPFQLRRHCPSRRDDEIRALAISLLESPFEDGRTT